MGRVSVKCQLLCTCCSHFARQVLSMLGDHDGKSIHIEHIGLTDLSTDDLLSPCAPTGCGRCTGTAVPCALRGRTSGRLSPSTSRGGSRSAPRSSWRAALRRWGCSGPGWGLALRLSAPCTVWCALLLLPGVGRGGRSARSAGRGVELGFLLVFVAAAAQAGAEPGDDLQVRQTSWTSCLDRGIGMVTVMGATCLKGIDDEDEGEEPEAGPGEASD